MVTHLLYFRSQSYDDYFRNYSRFHVYLSILANYANFYKKTLLQIQFSLICFSSCWPNIHKVHSQQKKSVWASWRGYPWSLILSSKMSLTLILNAIWGSVWASLDRANFQRVNFVPFATLLTAPRATDLTLPNWGPSPTFAHVPPPPPPPNEPPPTTWKAPTGCTRAIPTLERADFHRFDHLPIYPSYVAAPD
jgi:hypothetical protein